ncbi:MAG: acyl-CoA thioesterase [Ktedonobacterales bacterium]
MTSSFDAETALEPTDNGAFTGRIIPSWSVGRGPNGGFIAALLMRALLVTVDDPARGPRSLTIHYLAPAEDGPVRITTAIERSGRSLTALSARMLQGDRLIALALAAFDAPREIQPFSELTMPDAPPPEASMPFPPPGAPLPAFTNNYTYRWGVGDLPFSGSSQARLGGWMRLAQPGIADATLVAAFMDAWMPAIFPRLTQPAQVAVPTIDLTIHFRTRLPLPGATPDDYYLATFSAPHAADGSFVEDGELWSRDGILIAQSRQLALMPPLT